MGVTSRTGFIYVIYKKSSKKIIQTTDQYTEILLKNRLQKTLHAIIGEGQSASTLSTIRDIIFVSNKLNITF